MSMEEIDKIYSQHIDRLRLNAPDRLEESSMVYIRRREAERRRFISWLTTAAAAVVLILLSTLFIVPQKSQEMDYGDKLITLVEAYKLFPEEESLISEDEIIYEDELIIIYIK